MGTPVIDILSYNPVILAIGIATLVLSEGSAIARPTTGWSRDEYENSNIPSEKVKDQGVYSSSRYVQKTNDLHIVIFKGITSYNIRASKIGPKSTKSLIFQFILEDLVQVLSRE